MRSDPGINEAGPSECARNTTPNRSETARASEGAVSKSKQESDGLRGTELPIFRKMKSLVPTLFPSYSSSSRMRFSPSSVESAIGVAEKCVECSKT